MTAPIPAGSLAGTALTSTGSVNRPVPAPAGRADLGGT